MLEKNKNHRNGYIGLTSILIIGAFVLLVAIGVSLRSIGETDMSLGEQQSSHALSLANLCVEQAIMKLESVFTYAGNETVTIGSETCDILAISGSGNAGRTIQAQSTVGGYTRKVQAYVATISTTMSITSWEEVADF